MRKNKLHIVGIILAIVIIISGCKKYPENTVLVSPPEVVLKKLSGAKVIYCKVNGIDSTELMGTIWSGYTEYYFDYSIDGYGYSPGSSYFHNCVFRNNTYNHFLYILTFSNNKKQIKVQKKNTLQIIPTLNQNEIVFEIEKLTTKDLKLTTNVNNKTYELYLSK